MTDIEQILWNRNKDLSDRITIMNRALAKVLISASHDDAISCAKEAFATLALDDPFATKTPEKVKEEAAA